MDRDEFFAQLDQLTPKEIEERLSSWDVEQLVLAQEYLAQKQRAQTRAALAEQAETGTNKDDAARLSVDVARRAHTRAMMALIFQLVARLGHLIPLPVANLRSPSHGPRARHSGGLFFSPTLTSWPKIVGRSLFVPQ